MAQGEAVATAIELRCGNEGSTMAVAVKVDPTPQGRARGTAVAAPPVRTPDGPYARARGRADALDHATRIEAAFRRHYDTLVQICRERTADASRAEDLAQETLVRALRYGHSFDPSKPVLPWLRTIATRVVIDDAARAANRREQVTDLHTDHDLMADDVVDEEALAAVAGDPRIRQAFSSLTAPQQIAMRLRYVEDWSGGDTANFLGISRAACDQVVARAKRRMRDQLDQLGEAYPVLAPLTGTGLLARLRLWVAERRAAISSWELGAPSAAAIAETVAVVVAVTMVAVAGSAGPSSASASEADAASLAERNTIDAAAELATFRSLGDSAAVGSAGSVDSAWQSSSTSGPDGSAPVGSSRTYSVAPSSPAYVDDAPAPAASAEIAGDEEAMRVQVDVSVSVAGNDIAVTHAELTLPCAGSGTTCRTFRVGTDQLPDDQDPVPGPPEEEGVGPGA